MHCALERRTPMTRPLAILRGFSERFPAPHLSKQENFVLVVDWDKSERGPQRRLQGSRLVHCCCVCGKCETWNSSWSTYCSEREIDDSVPIPKFCSEPCRSNGGSAAKNVTQEMKQRAKDAEWREPETKYREATSHEKYDAAVRSQQPTR